MVIRESDLPPHPPNMLQINQLLQDVENAPADDPVFVGGPPPGEDGNRQDSFSLAQEFMAKTQRLKELELLLVKQKTELEENHRELLEMVGTILQEAVTLQ